MDGDLRELLRAAAEDVTPDPRIPHVVAHRARRRRRLTGAVAGALAVSVLLGAAFGSRAALSLFEAAPSPRPGGGVAHEEWRGIWPYATKDEAEAAQAAVDAKDPAFEWLLDVEEVVRRFAVEELGWEAAYFDDGLDVSEPDEPAPLTLHASSCDTSVGLSVCKGAPHAEVTVERLLRRDRTGIWVVTGVSEDPGPARVSEAEVRAFVERFMEARLAGRGAEVFLTRVAAGQYGSGENGISLYSPTSNPHYERWRIVRVGPTGLDPDVYDVTVRVEEEYTGEGSVGSFLENLYVGPQEGADPSALFVISASRATEREEVAEAGRAVERFVGDFMAARLAGPEGWPSAEDFLAPTGRSQYREGAPSGDLYLYGNPWGDRAFTYVGYEIVRVEAADASSYEVTVDIEAQPVGEGEVVRLTETLFVGPGRDVNGADREFVVRGAMRVEG